MDPVAMQQELDRILLAVGLGTEEEKLVGISQIMGDVISFLNKAMGQPSKPLPSAKIQKLNKTQLIAHIYKLKDTIENQLQQP